MLPCSIILAPSPLLEGLSRSHMPTTLRASQVICKDVSACQSTRRKDRCSYSAAFGQIGVPAASDFNSGTLNGAQYCASTIDPANEVRASSQQTFLKAASAKLKIFSNTMAKKVLFDSNKKATGVQVKGPFGVTSNLLAKREVIVSGGAFHSPQVCSRGYPLRTLILIAHADAHG